MILEDAASRIGPPVLAALALVFVLGAGWYLARRLRRHRRLHRFFADTLPRAMRKRIAHTPSLFREESRRYSVTCLSCGLRDLAALANAFGDKPADFTKALERALAILGEAARAQGGTIGALTQEGFSAVWNAPLADDAPAAHACAAAYAMTSALPAINTMIAQGRRLDAAALPSLTADIAVATGDAIGGVLRHHGRALYTVQGEAMIRACRLQRLCALYGRPVIADAPTRTSAQAQFGFLQVDYRTIENEPPAPLYALLGNPLLRGAPKTRALMTFHDHIFEALRARQWDKARALIEQARQISADNPVLYDLHLARIAYFEANPPAKDWDGAFRAILK